MNIKITHKKKPEFSKRIVGDTRPLLWIITVGGLLLAFYCIYRDYAGELPWITTMMGLPWAAHGYITKHYLDMATSDHRAGGITYETAKSKDFKPDDSPAI